MAHDFDYTLNAATYARIRPIFDFLRSRIGLNVKLHGNTDLLNQGQIFVFNHFARFETAIPIYLIYIYTSALTRTVSHADLFSNPQFGKFLRSVGAVEHNKPNLLSFMAAEALRGHKNVIFPEGGLIKDRLVLDELGEFGIRKPGHDQFRKVHRGAAALALKLDLFKRRIRDRIKVGDEVRLEHWRAALQLPTIEKLIEEANKPTLIVPATITFHPIRLDSNVLNKAVDMLTRGKAPASIMEEMLIEGNLIFKDTDMDVLLRDPITPAEDWQWWETLILRRYFGEMNSLDDLFLLKDRATSVSGRVMMRCLNARVDKIRDMYMESLYKGVMINLSHLAATLLMTRAKAGDKTISLGHFRHTLYLTLKELQTLPEMNLHRSLKVAERYCCLPDATNRDLDRFLALCTDTKLIKITGDKITLTPALLKEWHANEVRTGNPAQVYANEAAPIKQVGATLAKHWAAAEPSAIKLAHLAFDDEVRAYTFAREKFAGAEYAESNALETATESGQPYLLVPEKAKRKGVLLVHGLLASPAELKEFGEKLYEHSHTVLGMRLAGHGTAPVDLEGRTYSNWLASVARNYKILSALCDEVVIVGFGSGAALSLMFAATKPEKLAGVASVGAPLTLTNRRDGKVPWTVKLRSFTGFARDHKVKFFEKPNENATVNYHAVPVSAVDEFHKMVKAFKGILPKVATNVLVMQADQDRVVDPRSASKIVQALTKAKTQHVTIKAKNHGIINRNIGQTHNILLDFVMNPSGKVKHE